MGTFPMDFKRRIRRIIKFGPWSYRFWRNVIRKPYEWAFPTPPISDDLLGEFPEAAELRGNFAAFRAEALEISTGHKLPINHEIMPEQRHFFEHDRIPWQMVPLRAYGFDYPENLARMPLMADFLRRNPHVVSATISVFPGGKHLRPHKGPFKGVWRYHLAYLVQDLGEGRTSAELTIDGRQVFLREGDDLLWDDTYMHEARNRSDSPRIVLLLDVMRKDHPWYLAPVSKFVMWITGVMQSWRGTRKKAALGAK